MVFWITYNIKNCLKKSTVIYKLFYRTDFSNLKTKNNDTVELDNKELFGHRTIVHYCQFVHYCQVPNIELVKYFVGFKCDFNIFWPRCVVPKQCDERPVLCL